MHGDAFLNKDVNLTGNTRDQAGIGFHQLIHSNCIFMRPAGRCQCFSLNRDDKDRKSASGDQCDSPDQFVFSILAIEASRDS
jgi:hypothetical protein